jgi:hypothetical protein
MKSKNVVQLTDADATAAREQLHKAKLVVHQMFKNDLNNENKAIMSGIVYLGMSLNRIADYLGLLLQQRKEDDTDVQR